MNSAKSDVESYLSAIDEYRDCLKKNDREAADSAQRIVDGWNSAVSQYNNR